MAQHAESWLENVRRAIRNGMALELRVDALLSAVFRVSPTTQGATESLGAFCRPRDYLQRRRAISDAHSETSQQEQREKLNVC
jgi:hypothetical protein